MGGASHLSVRDARPADLDAIVDFNLRLAFETEGLRLDRSVLNQGVRVALTRPDCLRYWVVEFSRTTGPVGQAAVSREWSDWRNAWLWWFQSVYVAPEARGKGVFRALYGHIREEARQQGDVAGLRLYVERENVNAQATYQRLGMKPGGYHVYEELWAERFTPCRD
ncbi:MAG: GNAT family N-acetyltransferase [Isosphaeraceae bacterium]|nr:GNAT family N-acetyltransferase [Isosphaeraceae bacterium]